MALAQTDQVTAIRKPNKEPALWGIHAGSTGDVDKLFLTRNCVAVGWHQVGDLSNLQPDREAFKKKVAAAYPDKKVRSVQINGGLLYRFVHEMKRGDIILYPSREDHKIHFGRIEGDYRFDESWESRYPHRRPVKWLIEVPRTQFSQGALQELGAAIALFQVKNYAEEFQAVLAGKPVAPGEVQEEGVAQVAEQIEISTRDFILKRLAAEFPQHALEGFIKHLLEAMGYRCRPSGSKGPDGGIDIIAHKDELGFDPPIIKIQVKSSGGSVGLPEVSALAGNVQEGEHGLVVTLGTFTKQAKSFVQGRTNLRLIDGDDLVALILSHYERFDSRYKGVLPLKHVYVPDPQEGALE